MLSISFMIKSQDSGCCARVLGSTSLMRLRRHKTISVVILERYNARCPSGNPLEKRMVNCLNKVLIPDFEGPATSTLTLRTIAKENHQKRSSF